MLLIAMFLEFKWFHLPQYTSVSMLRRKLVYSIYNSGMYKHLFVGSNSLVKAPLGSFVRV